MLNFIFTLLLLLSGECTKFDLIIICDYSGSISGHERVVSGAVSEFSKKLYIGEEDTKLGIVIFNDSSEVFCSLTTDTTYIDDRIKTLHVLAGGYSTNLSSALLSTYDEFKTNGREDVKKIIVLISDGEPNNKIEAWDIAKTLKMLNIEIFTLLVEGEDIDEEYMKQIASPNAYFSTNYQQLVYTLRNINFCL